MTPVVSLLGCFQDMLNPCKPMFNPLRDSCNKVIGHNRRLKKKNCQPVLYGMDVIQDLSEGYLDSNQW